MKSLNVKRLFCLMMAAAMLPACACVPSQNGKNDPTAAPDDTGERFIKLSANITPAEQTGKKADEAFNEQQADFAVRLFQNSLKRGENSLVSPLSALLALSMTANGAYGKTLSEMESALGMPINELNAYLYSYMHKLVSNEHSKVMLANSIWFKATEGEFDPAADIIEPFFTPKELFLKKNAAIYDADIFKAPFDSGTLDAVNGWVKENTDGMIDKILDEMDPNAIMFLVNTLLFDAEWGEQYQDYQVSDGVFTALSGERQNVRMMNSSEGTWIGDETCSGFLKYYKKSPYAFAALLPNEGTDVNAFIDGLSGERLRSIFQNSWEGDVLTSMPKFGFDYSVSLADALKSMGMIDAFDVEKADFSNLGTVQEGYNIYIGDVLHKTHIEVNERGTRAGAATLVEMLYGSAEPSEIREVRLDRPFVFLIMDMEANVPLFIGVVTSVE